ncbi:MAG: hypothetical protein R3D00_16335 [Bacteroidia bacterium]
MELLRPNRSQPHINQKIRYIRYIYACPEPGRRDAAGTKLSQEVVNTSNTVTKTSDYVGAFHYEDGDPGKGFSSVKGLQPDVPSNGRRQSTARRLGLGV